MTVHLSRREHERDRVGGLRAGRGGRAAGRAPAPAVRRGVASWRGGQRMPLPRPLVSLPGQSKLLLLLFDRLLHLHPYAATTLGVAPIKALFDGYEIHNIMISRP